MSFFFFVLAVSITLVASFRGFNNVAIRSGRGTPLKMLEIEANTATYAAMFVVTIVPSLAFVKFVGDQADNSRGSLSEETRDRFKRAVSFSGQTLSSLF